MATEDRHKVNKKPRSYYVDYTKGNNRFKDNKRRGVAGNSRYNEAPEISLGLKGFLITTIDEVKSYIEMRNILERNYESLYQNEIESAKNKLIESNIEDELESELKYLRTNRPFKQVKTHCRNSIFINIVKDFSHIDPIKIIDKFFDEIESEREAQTRNTFKVLPILDTCRCSVSGVKESVKSILEGPLRSEVGSRKYFVEFQSRGNYKLSSDDKQKMIEGVAEVTTSLRPDWCVSRDGADYIIVLVAMKNICCVTFLKDYHKRLKYNVVEFCKDSTPDTKQPETLGENKQSKLDETS